MTTLISNVKGVVNRHATLEDVRSFNSLVNNSGGAVFFRATFGQFNFSTMVETSCVSMLSMSESTDACLAYMCVTDCPSIGKDGDAYDKTLELIKDHVPGVTSINSMFVNFLLLDERPDYDMDSIGRDLLFNCFKEYPELDYILWLCPSAVKLTDWTVANFIEPESEELREACEAKSNLEEPLKGQRLLYAHRDNFLPKLHVRDARIEDNDDLLPILKDSAPGVFDDQGNYFLADLIQQQDENNRIFVGISKNQPVGMLATSVEVNVGLITKVFNVDQYPDLFIAKQKSPPLPPLVIGLIGDIRALGNSFINDLVKSNRCAIIDVETINIPGLPERGEDDESKEDGLLHAERMFTELQQRIQEVASADVNDPPPFTLVKGFPRTDAEAQIVSQNPMVFDMVLEIQNEATESDPDEVDEFLVQHMEAVEALQSFLTIENAPHWKKIAYNGTKNRDECENEFGDTFRDLVLARVNELDAISQREDDEPPTANAFAITVFCMRNDYVSRADDIIRVAFEDHPQFDYCMYMVPNNSASLNTLVGSMVATKLRTGMSFDQTLFIVHRESVIAGDVMTVERAVESNSDAVFAFIAPLGDGTRGIVEDIQDGYRNNDIDMKDNPMTVSFEVKVLNNVVGLVALNRKCVSNDDINWLRCNFEVDQFVNFDRHRARSQAYITCFILSPVFSRWARFIVREIMRKYVKTVLYFQSDKDVTPPKEIMDEFIPVPIRRRIEAGPGLELPLLIRPSAGFGVDCPLFHLTKQNLATPKITVLKRVVIFGGGTASFSLLEKLCFTSNYNFPNVYLVTDVAPESFCLKGSSLADYTPKCTGVLSCEDIDNPTMSELYGMGLGHRVHCIQGRLTDIDRGNKAVIISDELIVEYDLLIIASTTKDKSFKKFPATSGMHSSACEKRGIFGLGDPYTDTLALKWIQNQDKTKWPTIVYGTGIDVVSAIGALMKLGIPSRRISAVIPSDDLPENCHPQINETIIRALRSSGVQLHRGFDIVDVELSTYGTIQNAVIKLMADPDAHPVTVPCFSLICCNKKFCDSDVFAAVNDCGIVYDGGIVVDKDFRTVDPAIYAVGDFSRFSRVYLLEPAHNTVSTREMGLYVADRLLSKHLHCPSKIPEDAFAKIPQFKHPRGSMTAIAGGKFYFNSKLSKEPFETNVLISGDVTSERLCAVKVDSLGIVVEICYVGKSEVEARNLNKIVGWHESYLNAAMSSYEDGKVEDWIDFFRGEWATAFFHDKFTELAEAIRASLSSDKGAYTILDSVNDAIEASTDNDKINEAWRTGIGPHGEYLEPATKRIVESSTVDYLRTNKMMLNRFAIPNKKKDSSK